MSACAAFTAPCVKLNGKFDLLGTGLVLNFMGTAAPLVLQLEGWRGGGDAAGSCWAMDLGQELHGAPRR